MTPAQVVQARCEACTRRILDYVNQVVSGRVVIRRRCKCGHMNEVTVSAPTS